MYKIEYTEVIEINARTAESTTNPFYCRCDDGEFYYVKGRDAGGDSLCSETIAGLIAKDWKLPIPAFKIVSVPSDLIQYSTRDDINDLGQGLAWGVQAVPDTTRYAPLFRKEIPTDLCTKILLFDWFIKNEDRSQNNPNMLWSAATKQLTIIDHNIAFDPQFRKYEFWSEHVFAEEREQIFTQSIRADYENLLNECIVRLPDYLASVPSEWREKFSFDEYQLRVERLLSEPKNNPELFWGGK